MRLRFAFFTVLTLSACSSAPTVNPWGEVRETSPGEARPIGFYSAGCMSGGISLPPDGPGYEIMRTSRRRYYGQPTLIQFIRELGAQVHRKKLGTLLVGDLAQPRGGPMAGGHDSHQTGLDVDLWFWQPDAKRLPLTLDERETLSAHSVLTDARNGLNAALFSKREAEILKLTAQDPRVGRIFVDPWIKKSLCEKNHGQAWLAKLRPWHNHDDHFHVRLNCPEGAPSCTKQEPVPAGDGCDATLDWWFTPEANQPSSKPAKKTLPKLPEECGKLISAP